MAAPATSMNGEVLLSVRDVSLTLGAQKILDKTGMALEDFDHIEVNEAFAPVRSPGASTSVPISTRSTRAAARSPSGTRWAHQGRG